MNPNHDRLVNQIVAATGFEESDRAWLDVLNDAQLVKFAAHCAPASAPAVSSHARPTFQVAPMPGIRIGTSVLRTHTGETRRHGPDGHFYMPGLPIGRAST